MLDSQVKQLIDLYYSMDLPDFNSQSTVEEVRELMTRFFNKKLVPDEESTCRIKEISVQTSFGEIKVRGYYPKERQDVSPILFFRGCGFVVDNFKESDSFCIRLAEACETFVLSIDYPLAPEYPYPASIEACYQVYQWIVDHISFLNLDPSKMVGLGESSGGCLLASLIQMLRDKQAPQLGYQVLLYPVTDFNFETSSYQKLESGYILTKQKMKWYLEQYLGVKENASKPYAFPMNSNNLRDLPPSLILTAEFDPLVDDGLKYATLLKESGVSTEYICFAGLIHGFMKFSSIRKSDEAFTILTDRIKSFIFNT